MKNKRIQVGDKFGRLTVVAKAEKTSSGCVRWKSICECGNMATSLDSGLKRGRTNSCGCLQKESVKKYTTTHGFSRKGKYILEYRIWSVAKSRCFTKTYKGYKNYGARGIIMCDRWRNSFANFISDMGGRPSTDYSLERINNNGNYEPSNCRWATDMEQNRNKRTNHWVEYEGKKMIATDWAAYYGIDPRRFFDALSRNGDHKTMEFYKLKYGK